MSSRHDCPLAQDAILRASAVVAPNPVARGMLADVVTGQRHSDSLTGAGNAQTPDLFSARSTAVADLLFRKIASREAESAKRVEVPKNRNVAIIPNDTWTDVTAGRDRHLQC